MNAATLPDANQALFRCVQDWHPEERLWLEQYVAAVKERYPDAVSRLLL